MNNTLENSPILNIEQEIEINATPEVVFRGLIDQLKNLDTDVPGKPMSFELEAWPGGRWYRNLGEGSGHLWGFVQSIKPPVLLEFFGPLMMSNATANNVIFRIEATENGARVKFRHQCLGEVSEEFRLGMVEGWGMCLEGAKKRAEG